jgi:hypothetical protein
MLHLNKRKEESAMTLEKQVQDMIDILTANKAEAIAADKGNKAAAKRLRAGNALLMPIIKAVKAQSLGR